MNYRDGMSVEDVIASMDEDEAKDALLFCLNDNCTDCPAGGCNYISAKLCCLGKLFRWEKQYESEGEKQ